MKNLDDLLDQSFGPKQVTGVSTGTKIQKVKTEYRKQRGIYMSKDECKDLIFALNYAINSIKNKKDVVEKKETSTRYEHFKRWTKILEKIKDKLER